MVPYIPGFAELRSKKKNTPGKNFLKHFEHIKFVLAERSTKIDTVCTKYKLLTPSELGDMPSQRRISREILSIVMDVLSIYYRNYNGKYKHFE